MIKGNAVRESRTQSIETNSILLIGSEAFPRKGSFRILHVDDDVCILGVSKQILSMENDFEIESVTSVDDAFKKMEEKTYDAIVSDFEMPQKNGLDFLQELRQQQRDIPFILFTGKGREEVAIKALNLGADAYVNKNGNPETVYGELSHALINSMERKNSKKLLIESEAKFQKLVENSLQGIAIIQGPPPTFVFANVAMEKVFGLSCQELVALSSEEIVKKVHPADREAFFSRFSKRMQRKEVESTYEFRGIGKDGSIKWYQVCANLIEYDGRPSVQAAFLDVTEQKKIEDALRRSQEMYKGLADSLPEIIFETDTSGKLVYANEKAFEITGYSKEDLAKGVCAFDFFEQKDKERIKENFRKALANKPSDDFEYEFVRKDSTTFPVIIKRNPIVVDNKTVGLRGIAIEISGHKKAADETTFLASIVQNSDDAIIGKSLDGIITSWNNGAQRIYGYEASEVIGKSIHILVPAKDQEEITDLLRRIRAGEHISHYETRRIRKDGMKMDVSLTISPIRNKENVVIGASTIARDITEQKIAEETLKQAEENYEALLNAANVLVQSVDSEGKYRFVNEEWKKVLGYTAEDLKNISLMDVVRGDHFQYCMSVFKDVKNGACVRDVETVFVAKDGREITVSGNACPIFKDDKFVSSVAFFVDISNRKKNEAQLKENSRRIELMNEKLRVVGGLTRHDVRNKLSAVTGYTYILMKRHSDQADIVEALVKMEQAVTDSMKIFDFAKLYEQIGSEELTYVDVEEKVKEASELFSVPLPKINNECHGLTLLADSFLRQLFYNFIDNTRKYGEKATTIRVYFERTDQDILKLVYEDDGVGVPFENKPRLFSEGFSTGGSTGFGLFLTKKMIDVYGWTISEDGQLGKGAKFVITIPKLNKNRKENY